MTQGLSKNKGMARRFLSVLLAALVCMATLTLQPTVARATVPAAQPIPVGGTINTPGLYDISMHNGVTSVTVAVNGVALTGTNGDLSVQIGTGITLTRSPHLHFYAGLRPAPHRGQVPEPLY